MQSTKTSFPFFLNTLYVQFNTYFSTSWKILFAIKILYLKQMCTLIDGGPFKKHSVNLIPVTHLLYQSKPSHEHRNSGRQSKKGLIRMSSVAVGTLNAHM